MAQIIWLNGAFGSGKTQTAGELHRRLPGSFVFDPEKIGAWIWKNEPSQLRCSDFQNEPLWREFNYKMLSHICVGFNDVIIVPMTLTNPIYYDELIGKLRADGVIATHVVLAASQETLLKRLHSRFDGPSSWPAAQIPRCIDAFKTEKFENKIETDKLSIPEVAERVAELCELKLLPRQRGLRQRWNKLITSLNAIRR
jgi:hypothetical protein